MSENLRPFEGFGPAETFTALPDSFFALLGQMDDVDEIRAALLALRQLEHCSGALRFFSLEDLLGQKEALQGWDEAGLQRGLEKAVSRGILLQGGGARGGLFVLNSARGRLTLQALEAQGGEAALSSSAGFRHTSKVFSWYEENFGPLTPLLADALAEAEAEFPSEWIFEAFQLAVARQKRNWSYVKAILKRWKEEGKNERNRKQDPEQAASRYTDNAFSEFLD